MSARNLTILGVPGSLRENSFNKALIYTAREVAPDGVQVEPYLLDGIPFYNADIEAQGLPAPVADFKAAIARADGVLFSTPQYNRSVSGVLKNAIDWASRPAFKGPLAGKPVAIIGATSGQSATEVARQDLGRILGACRAEVLESSFGLVHSADHIDEGECHSDEVREQVREILDEFAAFIREQSLVRSAD